MTLAVDASLVVAALLDDRGPGEWARGQLAAADQLVSAQMLPAEVVSTLRRLELSGAIGPDTAALAHQDHLDLPVELLPYHPLASRIWALRANVTAYDAWYVAVAEALDAPLATLDHRLVRSPGPCCTFLSP